MIKGVNKKIIEINNPDSIYFEKAVFYLRPNVMELPGEISRAEILHYISKLGLEYQKPHKKPAFLRIALTAAAVLTITLLFIFM